MRLPAPEEIIARRRAKRKGRRERRNKAKHPNAESRKPREVEASGTRYRYKLGREYPEEPDKQALTRTVLGLMLAGRVRVPYESGLPHFWRAWDRKRQDVTGEHGTRRERRWAERRAEADLRRRVKIWRDVDIALSEMKKWRGDGG